MTVPGVQEEARRLGNGVVTEKKKTSLVVVIHKIRHDICKDFKCK